MTKDNIQDLLEILKKCRVNKEIIGHGHQDIVFAKFHNGSVFEFHHELIDFSYVNIFTIWKEIKNDGTDFFADNKFCLTEFIDQKVAKCCKKDEDTNAVAQSILSLGLVAGVIKENPNNSNQFIFCF